MKIKKLEVFKYNMQHRLFFLSERKFDRRVLGRLSTADA
jgi:hypothetical protein